MSELAQGGEHRGVPGVVGVYNTVSTPYLPRWDGGWVASLPPPYPPWEQGGVYSQHASLPTMGAGGCV